uniref:Endonuclease/exonuclease/phosphatase domain-containing protein n=1 Tax=Chromera velia CCMP2878 TaxID=1169474 RepID=A0A0G4GM20_9ALVE|eukprot:Cvel_22495.t1-p1 / transcript=Cvel_22495.t1 / gene=Cvel_22495 / organism=Chromera_velia_CCMP2878 / gene_product=hypothetical protein / transcript_product=hypothetical protein / location=Cvel_scaffold2217:3287-5001(-) / protein_length=234 / sequence_SO=supercontig / SO=protein_coding / is_pseudo=false
MVRHSQFLAAPKAGVSRWCTDSSVQSWQQLVAAGEWAAHGKVAVIMLLEILGHLLKLVEVVGDEGPIEEHEERLGTRKIRNGDIRSWLTETDADVVVLVETQHLSCDLELGGWKGVNWSHREWRRRKTKVHSACADKEIRSGGVCILVKSDRWGELRPEFKLVGPSIARVAIYSSSRKLHVFGVYLPEGWSNHKKDDTKEILSDSLCSVPLGELRVVLGDLNSHTASLCLEGLE